MSATQRHRVVVVGGGFGGLPATRVLAAADFDITLIESHHSPPDRFPGTITEPVTPDS